MAKALSRTVSIYIDGKQVESTLASLQREQQRLINQQKKLVIGTDEYIATGKKLREINAILTEQRAAVRDMGNSWESALSKLSEFGNVFSGLQSIVQMGDDAVSTLKQLASDAAELDDAYADVMKTTGLTKEQVRALNEEFKKMDTRTSREQLNQLAYEAGKLGLNTQEAVAQFVSAADKINIALGDVLGDGAMVTIGKLTDIYGRVTEQLNGKDLESRMLAIGSAINMLGQSSTANENYMVEFMKRLGGIASQARLSADQILGFASALDQNGQAVEMSATAFQKLIQQMIKKPQEFLNAAKMSLSDFQHMMDVDMNGAIQRVLKGMDEMGSFNTLVPMFADMGLDGARATTVLSSLAASLDKVAEAQQIANEELTTGTSVLNEFSTKNSSMAAEAEKAKKAFEDMRIELGEQLYPVIIHLTKASTAALKGFAGYLNLWKENKVAAVALTSAMATLVGWYTRSYAIKLKNKALDVVRDKLRDLESLKTKQQQLAEARLTAQREKAALAAIREQMAIQQKIIADHAEYAAMGQTNLVIVAQSNLRRLQAQYTAQATVATTANTAAMQAQKAVFASTPWGLVITALTSIALVTARLVTKAREGKKEIKELNAAIGSETARISYLFKNLQDAERGTEDYTKAVNALKEAYPDLIQDYIDEEGYINNISFARNQLIEKIREQIAEQKKLEKVQQIGSDYDVKTKSAASRIRDWYIKHYGEAQGQLMYEDQMAAMASGYDNQVDLSKGKSKAEQLIGRKMPGGRYNFSYGGLVGAIEDYNAAINAAAKSTKELDDVYKAFGVTASTVAEELSGGSGQGNNDSGESGFLFGSLTKEQEKFEKVKTSIEETLLSWQNKQKKGIEELFSEIDLQSQRLIDRVNNSTGSSSQKQTLIGRIIAESDELKRSKTEDYLKKLGDEAAKLEKTSSSNPMLQQVLDAARQLKAELAAIDAKAEQVRADLAQAGLSETDRENLQQLLQQYDRIRAQMQQRAYSSIDASVDISGFSATGDVAKDAAQYAKLMQQINRNREALVQLRDIQTDPAVAAEYQDQLDTLNDQEQALREILGLSQKMALDAIDSPFTKFLKKSLSDIEFFANKATEIFSSLNQVISNGEQQEYNDFRALQDQKVSALDKQLEQGLLSQEDYDRKKAALDEQTEQREKEMKLRQWERDKQLSMGEAVIEGALAILRVFSEKGNGDTGMRIAQAALVGATTAAQIAAIASQPKPYAKGGYTSEPTILVGERGKEWVASHPLLTNPRTAPIISALESYQRGDNAALDAIAMQGIDTSAVSSVAAYRRQQAANEAAMLTELRLLRQYLSDPLNRQAIISRQTQEVFDRNESFLRNARKI